MGTRIRPRGIGARLEAIAARQGELAVMLRGLPQRLSTQRSGKTVAFIAGYQTVVQRAVRRLSGKFLPAPRRLPVSRGQMERDLETQHAKALQILACAQGDVACLAGAVSVPDVRVGAVEIREQLSEIWREQYKLRDKLCRIARLDGEAYRRLMFGPRPRKAA